MITTTVLEQVPDLATERRWLDFLTRADYATHYASPDYFREPNAAHDRFFAILAHRGEMIVGVLTGTRKGRRLACGLRSRPQVAFDVSDDRSEIAAHLAAAVLKIAVHSAQVALFSWERLPSIVDLGFRESNEPEGIAMLDLSKGPDQLLKEMATKRRTDIRKGIKNGIEVREATDRSDIEAYLRIREGWTQRKGLPPLDLKEQRLMFDLRRVRRLFVATHNGEVIAGSVVRFHQNGVLEYAANASLSDKMVLRTNDVLQWRIIEWGCAQGFKRYSFGGAHPFLRKFGGIVHHVYGYRMDRTFFRRYDLSEWAVTHARRAFAALPEVTQQRIRSAVRYIHRSSPWTKSVL